MQENAFIGIGPDLVKLFSGALLHVQSAFADSRRTRPSGALGERTRAGCRFWRRSEKNFSKYFRIDSESSGVLEPPWSWLRRYPLGNERGCQYQCRQVKGVQFVGTLSKSRRILQPGAELLASERG
jgi:hypothetical protein